MFVDTHVHLGDSAFDPDRDAIIASAVDVGVLTLVEIACAPADWAPAIALATRYPGQVRCAFGIHPASVAQNSLDAVTALHSLLIEPCAVAVGEIGLDYWWEPGRKTGQLALLEAQLALCSRFDKPAVFHARNGRTLTEDAYADLLTLLENRWDYAPRTRFRGVLHCFSGSWEDARRGLDLGLALGVNGIFTYRKNEALRETIRKVGIDHIVLETDCPYLPPQSARGRRNHPGFIPEIAGQVAADLGLDRDRLAAQTTANAVALFGPLTA